jgi:tryptophan synthase alpha chain
VDAGADVIELGVPFSDPMADGPALQRAAERALAAGTTLHGILDVVVRFRRRCDVPIVLFGYANPFLSFGCRELAKAACDAGVDGLLCVDMPPDEADVLRLPLGEQGIDMIFLLAPTSTQERIQRVIKAAAGFVYFVSVAGVTGVKAADTEAIAGVVSEIRRQTPLPVGIGFGITEPEQARACSSIADAVVVGSEIARLIERADDTSTAVARVAEFTREMKQATRRTR